MIVKNEIDDVNMPSVETNGTTPEFVSPTNENIISVPATPSANNTSAVDVSSDEVSDVKNEEQSAEQKPKVRRRGSELSILEQWGWHKNRRSTRKKSIQPDQVETVDTTIKGFLKRILPSFFV